MNLKKGQIYKHKYAKPSLYLIIDSIIGGDNGVCLVHLEDVNRVPLEGSGSDWNMDFMTAMIERSYEKLGEL